MFTTHSGHTLPVPLISGVPQGSSLGPDRIYLVHGVYHHCLSFTLSPIPHVRWWYSVLQLLSNFWNSTIARLSSCIDYLAKSYASLRLQLNPSKTEFIWFGSRTNLLKIPSSTGVGCVIPAGASPGQTKNEAQGTWKWRFLSASLYFSKRGAYWDRLCREWRRWSLVVTRVHCGQTVHPRPIYYGTLIGNPTPGIQWYNFRPPGVTPNRGMGPPWGAFCQITLTSCLQLWFE